MSSLPAGAARRPCSRSLPLQPSLAVATLYSHLLQLFRSCISPQARPGTTLNVNEQRAWVQHDWSLSARGVTAAMTAECGVSFCGPNRQPAVSIAVANLQPRKLLAAAVGVAYAAGLPLGMPVKERDVPLPGGRARAQIKGGMQRRRWGFDVDLEHVAAVVEL